MISVEEYKNMESDEIPYTTNWDFTLTNIEVECPDCQAPLEDVKYKLNEFENCLDVKVVGVCHPCKAVVTGKPLRIYRDGRFMWKNDDGQWVVREETWFGKLCRKFSRWLNS